MPPDRPGLPRSGATPFRHRQAIHSPAIARQVGTLAAMVAEYFASAPWATERVDVEQLLDRPAWQARAACRGLGTERFFPEEAGDDVEPALAVCRGCPVKRECLNYAQNEPRHPVGVWGGTTERQRRALRRESA
jgi:WhiB family redox-sensing transcriptional regulator